MFKTANGVEITLGMRVFTNDYAWGTVTESPKSYDDDGWFMVKIDDDAPYCAGHTKSYNGERMTTRGDVAGQPDPHPVVPSPVEAFMKVRPDYDREIIEEAAAHNESKGVPFCTVCADWHYPFEVHSWS